MGFCISFKLCTECCPFICQCSARLIGLKSCRSAAPRSTSPRHIFLFFLFLFLVLSFFRLKRLQHPVAVNRLTMPERHNVPPSHEELPSDIYEDLTELDPSPMAESPTGSVRSDSRASKPSNLHNCNLDSSNHDNQNSNQNNNQNNNHNQNRHQAPPFGKLSLWLARTQRYSSYAFTSFLSLHFTTTALVPLVTRSVHTADSSLLLARTVYQSQPTLEYLLIPCSLGVHILSGVGLRLRRHYLARKRYGQAPSFWARQSWSPTSVAGWVLVPPLAAHAIVLRIVPLLVEGSSADVGLGYVSHGFAYHSRRLAWWLNAGFYTGFVTVACFHVVNGMCFLFFFLSLSPSYGFPVYRNLGFFYISCRYNLFTFSFYPPKNYRPQKIPPT